MANRKTHGYPVLIIGAGRGGTALLEMLIESQLVEVAAIADPNPAAPGIKLARQHNIPTYTDAAVALQIGKSYPDCIVYNLTHDDAIAKIAGKILGNNKVTSGFEAKMFWQMVTNLKRVKGELEKSQDQLKAIISHAMDGIITINESGEIQGFNPAAEEIFGYTQAEVSGKNIKLLITGSAAGDPERVWGFSGRGREVTAMRKSGTPFPMELSASEMTLSGQRYFVLIARDITERKRAEQKIEHLAHHDYLTDLPNRALFLDRLEHSISQAKRYSYKSVVIFLDLDGFKQINDTLGHEAGDMLLKECARRLNEITRESDTVARVGGDEFTFILNNIGTAENATLVAQRIIGVLAQPFEIADQQRTVGGSIGISIFPDDSSDYKTLLLHADEAMYLAKQSGKNTYKFYGEVPSHT